MEWEEYVKFLAALIAIVDVPGNLPMFLDQTEGFSKRGRLATALVAAAATAFILLMFAFFGEAVLGLFSISIDAFKVVGGLVILLMALEMLGLRDDRSENYAGATRHPVTIGVFPMAVPLFAGPGAISAVMVYASVTAETAGAHTDGLSHDMIVTGVILSVCMMIFLGLALATTAGRMMGPITRAVINRLLGVIVATMGMEFILDGLAAVFPRLVN